MNEEGKIGVADSAAENGDDFGIAKCTAHDLGSLPEGRSDVGLVMLCFKGRATVEHNHIAHELPTHGIYIVFPGNIFSFADISDDFEMYRLYLSNDIFDETTYNLPNSFFSHIADKPVYGLSEEEFYSFASDHLRVIISKIADRDNICRREMVVNLLCNLFLEIYDKIVRFCRIDTSSRSHRKRLFDRFADLLWAYPYKRDVSFFADKLCITPKYLSVICNDTTGIPAKEFIDRCLICELKQMLRTTDLTVKQIAERFDFPSTGNMCRYFKARTGITISAYRQSVKGGGRDAAKDF